MDSNKTTLRVLLVEDSEHDRIAFHRALKKSPVPCDITEFIRAEEALKDLREKEPAFDIIVADHGLPGMTGLDFCREVIAEDMPFPLILLTGSGTEEIAVQAMKAGVHDYIIKDDYSRYLDLLPLSLLGAVRQYKEKFLRLQAEEKIRRQNEFLISILESLSHPFYVIDATDYRIIQANSAAKLGNLDERPSCYALTHHRESPCQGPEDTCPLEEVKKTKRPVVVEHIHFDKEGKKKDVEVHAYPIFNQDGEVNQVIEYTFDITERKRAESNLREAREYVQRLIDSSLDMIISVDQDRNIVMFNRAAEKTFGYAQADVMGKNVGMLYADPSEGLKIKEVLEKVGDFSGEITNKRKNGETFPSLISVSILKSHEGEFLGIMGISRDITERKKAEEALRQAKEKAEEATKLKDKFVSLVAHDLKEPLASMLGFLAFIRRDLNEVATEKTKGLIELAVNSGEKMVTLIDDLLSVSRLKTGVIKPKSVFLDAYFSASKIIFNYENLAIQKGIHLENRMPEKTRVFADPTLFDEVLQNLVSNAIKSCRQGDRITLSFSKDPAPCITVSDTGVGIKPERLGKIFSYEEKTSTRGTMGEKGTGLGLPLCRDIVEGHQGTLSVESVPGQGSVFSVRLPLVRPRVLVVDDSKNVRRLLEEFLKEVDVETFLAEDAKKALEILKEIRPHLIITDLMMPDLDGFEFLRLLKTDEKTKSIPIIAVTADTKIETRERAFRLGAEDFIAKPLNLEDLIPRVRKILV